MKQTFILLLLVSFVSCSTKDNSRNDNLQNDSVEQKAEAKNIDTVEYRTIEIADNVYYKHYADSVLKEKEFDRMVIVLHGEKMAEDRASIKMLQMEWANIAGDKQKQRNFVANHKSQFTSLGIVVENAADAENVLVTNTDALIKALKLNAEAETSQTIGKALYKEAYRLQQQAEALN